MNVAIIVAAGVGKRFGAEKPKQFLELAGKSVIEHTLRRFEDCAGVDEIVLVLAASEIENFAATVGEFRKLTAIVAGGATRVESVWKGLQAIENKAVEVVAIHDGARPLVTADEIERTIAAAKTTGASILVAPVTDTIKIVADNRISGTIDRQNLRRALTPQCFQSAILRRAFAENQHLHGQATDESFLVEQLGVSVAIVEGSARNIKITVPEDLALAELLLKNLG